MFNTYVRLAAWDKTKLMSNDRYIQNRSYLLLQNEIQKRNT